MTSIAARDASPDPRAWRLTALEPVWVPYETDEEREAAAAKKQGRKTKGPNDEPEDSGKWRLRWPSTHPVFHGRIFEGELISVSSLDTASECLMKWGLDHIYDLPRLENRKAALGNLRHDELEAWGKYGIRSSTPGMNDVLAHFPAPGDCENEVFFGFAIERPDGSGGYGKPVVIAGWIDARQSAIGNGNGDVAIDENGDDIIVFDKTKVGLFNSIIYDLKTTGDFRWKKTAAQLRANIQAAAYALGEMLRVEAFRGKGAAGTDLVLLRWVYAQLKELTNKDKTPIEESKCEIVRVEMVDDLGERSGDAAEEGWNGVWLSREEALAVIAQYIVLAETLRDLMERKHAGEKFALPKNGDACESYGGCGWKKLNVTQEWEEIVPVWRLVSGKTVKIETREKRSQSEKACTPPVAVNGVAGFMARHKQEMAKKNHGEGIGGHAGVEKVLGQLRAQNESATEQNMGLADRFGGAVKTTTTQPPPQAQATQPPPQAQQASGGLGARFAKSTGGGAANAPASNEPKPADVKATSDGMASGSAASSGGTAPPLAQRLKALKGTGQAGGDAQKVENAVANAPSNSVATGQLATGINPPDAAAEWTQEQQIAESERIAGDKKGAVESGVVLEGVKGSAQTPQTQTSQTEAPKRGRGRPPGSTKAATAMQEIEKAADAAMEKGAIPVLEMLAKTYLEAGQRRHATVLLNACAELEALDSTIAAAA